MDFVETMAEYLDGYRQDVWDISGFEKKLKRIEAKYPGFKERYKNFGNDVDIYRDSGDDGLLVKLLKEGFILDGIFEQDGIEQFREKLEHMKENQRTWQDDSWELWTDREK